jgi:hypothetical protein
VAYRTEGSRTLHGIIHVHHMSDLRMGGVLARNFDKFKNLCNEKTLKNVAIVTHAHDEHTEEARQSLLRNSDMFFKPALALDAPMLRFDGSLESAHAILRLLIRNHPLIDDNKCLVM